MSGLNMGHKHNQSFYNFLSSYINDHMDQLFCDVDEYEGESDFYNYIPKDVELWNYEIKEIVTTGVGADELVLEILVETELFVYMYGRDYDGEQVEKSFRVKAYLDFAESQIKYIGIEMCDE